MMIGSSFINIHPEQVRGEKCSGSFSRKKIFILTVRDTEEENECH
jgi:hypothetical protein